MNVGILILQNDQYNVYFIVVSLLLLRETIKIKYCNSNIVSGFVCCILLHGDFGIIDFTVVCIQSTSY